jgi:hypothetical protein
MSAKRGRATDGVRPPLTSSSRPSCMRVEQVHREPPRPHQQANCLAPEDVGVLRSVGTKPLFEARATGATLWSERHFYPSLSQALGSPAPRCFSQGDDGVLAWSWRVDEALDIGSFQYPSGNEKGLASLQGLDFPSLFGSPTWARTRDLRINRLALDLPGNPHECSLSGGRASNISCPFHLRNAREGSI